MPAQWKIPLDKFGGVIHHVYENRKGSVAKWVDPDTTWTLELQIKSYSQGRSSVWFTLMNVKDTKQTFPFNVKRFMEMLEKVAIVNGMVLGTFGVKKHGTTYSMVFLGLGEWDAKM